MNDAQNAIDAAIADANRLRLNLKKKQTRQVRSTEERSLIKATIQAWFYNYRKLIAPLLDSEFLHDADEMYKQILAASDCATVRSKYDMTLKNISKELSNLRGYTLTVATNASQNKSTDKPPDFSPLIPDPNMQKILDHRWIECINCINANAPLAATVMMGGLLEALLLARINKETNKPAIFKAPKAPKDKSTGKTLPLKEWTLRNYIDVAHELRWISQSAKDIGQVLRDYRNYIHPYKELSHNVVIELNDASLFWEISKSISKQIIKSI